MRRERGITWSEFIRQTGIAPATLNRYERGKTEPRTTDLSQIAAALDCTVDELLKEE